MTTQHPPSRAEPARSPWPLVIGLILVMTAWRLGAAALLPVTQDEAYYFDWARTLAWGYFDHPPGVALLGIGTWFVPGSALAARLGGLAAGTLSLIVLARLYVNSGLLRRDDLTLALVLLFASLPALAGGILTTPDSALVLAWALALHEAERALAGDRRRWLTVGVAVGLGLLGKYTMLLIGPILLWAILRADPRALRTPWPYLGALLAVLVFSPNLWWNAGHDWLALRFQFGHGFALDAGALTPAKGAAATAITHSAPVTPAERAANLGAFAAGQLALWGLIALPLVAAIPRLFRRSATADPGPILATHARSLLLTATWFPLGFFALVALGSEVEANWPAMYLLAAPAVLAQPLRGLRRWVLGAAAANLLLVTLYIYHAATAALPLPDGQNRILRETHGFDALAAVAAGLPGPVYADRYQLTAMLRFYQPELAAGQWPGLTRPSEYLVGQIAPRVDPDAQREPFWIITQRPQPPAVGGFTSDTPRTFFDCADQGLVETAAPPCARPLHTWFLHHYRPDRPDRPDGFSAPTD